MDNSDRKGGAHGDRNAPTSRHRDSLDPDHMSADELARLEAETDPLIDLIGHVRRTRASSPAFDDPRFLAWYAAELRARHEARPDSAALLRAESEAFARRMLVRLQAERLGVECVNQAPIDRQYEVSAAASQMVELLHGSAEAAFADLSVAAGAGRALWDIECDTSVQLPPHLAGGGRYLALRVSGESMTPLMHSGDVVLVKLGTEIRPDSVVVARLLDHEYVVKRVGRLTPVSIELLSLNADFPAMHVPRSTNPVLGTVVLRWCAHTA